MNFKKEQEEYSNIKTIKCKNEYRCIKCGHTVYIHPSKNKELCEFCNRYIERNEKYNIENISKKNYLKARYLHFQRKLKGDEIWKTKNI